MDEGGEAGDPPTGSGRGCPATGAATAAACADVAGEFELGAGLDGGEEVGADATGADEVEERIRTGDELVLDEALFEDLLRVAVGAGPGDDDGEVLEVGGGGAVLQGDGPVEGGAVELEGLGDLNGGISGRGVGQGVVVVGELGIGREFGKGAVALFGPGIEAEALAAHEGGIERVLGAGEGGDAAGVVGELDLVVGERSAEVDGGGIASAAALRKGRGGEDEEQERCGKTGFEHHEHLCRGQRA